MAEIINRVSPKILGSTRAKGFSFVSLSERGLRFSKPAAGISGLREDRFIHFINDTNYWAFYVNEDSDGFRLTKDSSKGGYLVYSSELSRMFENSVGAKIGTRYFINETTALHNGYKVFEIITTASVEVVIDKVKRMNDQKKYVLNLTLPSSNKKLKKIT